MMLSACWVFLLPWGREGMDLGGRIRNRFGEGKGEKKWWDWTLQGLFPCESLGSVSLRCSVQEFMRSYRSLPDPVELSYNMSLMPYQDLKFLKHLLAIETKYSARDISLIKQALNNQVIRFQLQNPFIVDPFPILTTDQLPHVVLHMAKQMEEFSLKNFTITALENFVKRNFEPMAFILGEKKFHCLLFCQAVLRYLQEAAKSKEFLVNMDKMKVEWLVKLFKVILQSRRGKKVVKATTVEERESNHLIHTIFNALFILASVRYLREPEEEDLAANDYLSTAITVAYLLVQECEKEEEFGGLREYLSVCSHLLIFNGLELRPLKWLDFCLESNQALGLGEKCEREVSPTLVDRYLRSLVQYSKLDFEYQSTLLRTARNLLGLNIGNAMLIAHFQILMELIRIKIFPFLKKQVFDILIESQNKRNITVVDQIFMRVLSSGIDMLDDDIQRYTLILAQNGQSKRKEQFVLMYYYLYEQSYGKVQSQVINLILQVYLDQQLPIEKVELMVSKEANCISSDNLKRLHAVIGEKKMNLHLNLLTIILEKRRDTGIFKITKKSSHTFLNEQWLIAASGNVQVYKTYLKLIVQTLCGKSLQINPSFINLGSCVVKVSVEQHSQIQGDYLLRSLDYYSTLIRMAEKQEVFEETTFRYMIMLQAILGEKLGTESYSYFSKNFSRVAHPESTFLAYLEYLVVLLKNRSSVLLYLQAVLEFETHCNQLFYERRFFDVSFMARMVEESQYFRLSTYSMQVVTVLYELSLLVRDEQFQADYLRLMNGWSKSMSRADCKHLAYFFAFREIKQIFPFMKEREMKDPSDRIRLLWDLILKLAAQPKEKLQNYLIMGGNKIVFEWKGDEFVKRGIKITGNFFRNQSYELSWFVQIQTKDRLYSIWINNDRLFVEQQVEEDGKLKEKVLKREQHIKQLKKRPQVIDFQLRIDSQSRKISCNLRIVGVDINDLTFDGGVHEIRIGCKTNAFLKHILVNDGFLPGDLNGLNFHASILNRWEVRTASLAELTTQSFCDKFDFDHAFCCIGEMLRHFQHISLPFAYDIFVKLSGRLIANNDAANVPQLQLMMQVFGTIQDTYSSIRGRNKPLQPVLETDCTKDNSSDLFYLFVAGILPLTFWHNFTQAKREWLRNMLLFLLQTPAFRLLENSKLILFQQALRISAITPSFFQVCELILSTHQFVDNRIFSVKFRKLMQLARQGQPFLDLLGSFLKRMLQYLNLENGQFHQKKLRCKYLIVESANIRQIFQFCTTESKIALLHYYSQNPSFNEKGEPVSLILIKELVESIQTTEERCAVMPWLIVEIKQIIFRKKIRTFGEENRINPRMYHLYLELLLPNRQLGSEEEREDVLEFIFQIIKILKKDIANRKNEAEKREFEAYFHSSSYFAFIIQITEEIVNRFGNIYNGDAKNRFMQIYSLTMEVVANFEKKNFLQFMIKYRYNCSAKGKLLKALIECEQFKSLRLRQFSIFLQYLFETLLLIQQKSSLTFGECEELIKAIKEYLEFVLLQLDNETDVPKAVFYCFPRLSGKKQGSPADIASLQKELKKVSKSGSFVELRGGVYFKCVLIVSKLMRLCPNDDYNNIVQLFLFGPKNSYNRDQRNLKNLTRGSVDLYSYSGMPKQRSAIEVHTLDVYESYKLYFNKEDYPSDRINEQFDLTAFIADYFLMTIAQFLQQNAEIIDPSILQRYSNNFLRGSCNQRIVKDLMMSNEKVDYQSYQDLQKLRAETQISRVKLTRAQTYNPNTPLSPIRHSRNAESPFNERRDSDFLFPTGSPVKDRRKNTDDFSSESKRRADIFDCIIRDCKNWYKKESCKSVSKFFSDRAKEIRILELLHTHYVLKTEPVMAPLATTSKLKEGSEAFLRSYAELLKEERRFLLGEDEVRLEQRIRKVKKIYPYTSSKSPVLSIIQNCLPNMTCPITLKITKQDYDTRRNQESIYMNFYLNTQTQEESLHLPSEEVSMYDRVDNVDERWDEEIAQAEEDTLTKEKPYCEWITREGVYFCEYYFDAQRLVLTSKLERPNCDNLWYLKLGTPVDNLIRAQVRIEIIHDDVVEIFQRRFNQITNNSLEFFLKNGTSKFISFYRKSTLAAEMKNIERVFKGVKLVKDSAREFEECKFTQRWVEGCLSNFDYLMLLNKYSGRTYNDLNQYYVFPWVLKDYHSQKIDLSNPDIYRDLSKPIGAINPQKLKRYRQKYKNQSYNSDRCLYGSHYSTSLFVFYYLVRLQPFSSLHREMQKGNWDVADRLFNSIEQVWDSLTNQSNTSDIKESIPEFYYLPTFLKNIANIEFGQKQCGSDVGDVDLPPWAENADELVVTLRAALQSDYVSENLHLWIDLIFGKYQHSEEKHNIFHPYSYSDPQVLTRFGRGAKNIEGVICQISYFGQCPLQLFKREHKPKKTFLDHRPNRASYTGKSQSTASQIVCGEACLLPGWKIAKITCEGNEFILDLKNTATQQRLGAVIPAFVSQQGLKERLQDLTPLKKNDPKVQLQPKVMRNERNELLIGSEFLMDLDVKFHFDHSEMNELWIACFGCRGLRVYNWQLQQKWSWEMQQVKQVHLQSTRFIFSTPSGKLYFYSFLQRRLQEVIVFREVCDMTIKVIALPRLPSRQRNPSSYKILCIGDNSRVSIVSYCFQQVFNFTSQSRSLILS